MQYLSGDLLKVDKDIIIHGCNCFSKMKSGIAAQIASLYPEAAMVDKQSPWEPKYKLGKFTYAKVRHIYTQKPLIIINAYTQFGYGKDPNTVYTNYDALQEAFYAITKHADFRSKSMAYPCIGAGLGKGDWSIIQSIIDEVLQGIDHICVTKTK